VSWSWLLAVDTPSPSPSARVFTEDDASRILPGTLGLVFFLFLLVAMILLMRSMSTQLKRVPDHFPGEGDDEAELGGPANPSGSGAAAT